MALSQKAESYVDRIKDLQKSAEFSLREVRRRAKTAQSDLNKLRRHLVKGVAKDRAQQNLFNVLAKSKKELDRVQARLEEQIAALKTQAKAVAEAERAKRRARS